MEFSTITFLYYFIPAVMILYFTVPFKWKTLVLLIGSLFFYFWGESSHVLVMIISSLCGYVFGLLIDKYRENKLLSRLYMILSLAISFGFLCTFKYADFLIENVNALFRSNIALLNIVLPSGISFYTFQIASYTIDLYRGNVGVQKNPIKFMTYVSMFPQLIAGPIVRYSDVEKELNERKINIDNISYGIRRFAIGFAKKVLIANTFNEFTTIVNQNKSEMSVLFMWAFVIAYAFRIYFDFSGYSDMAIGIGKILGFSFPENFNYPYISKSITEFWRRWHMTLGSWFRDYIYIPLGGNRVPKWKWFRNIIVVWAFTGIWHGASWNFVLWGVFFAVLLIIEKLFLYKKLEKMPSIFSRIYTIFFILISWVIFDATTLSDIGYRLSTMFGISDVPFVNATTLYYLKSYLTLFIVAIIGSTPVVKNLITKIGEKKDAYKKVINVLEIVMVMTFIIVSTSYLIDGSSAPSLYFRF